MIKAVLLDMDNTLILNPDLMFAKTYLHLFEEHFRYHLGFGGEVLRRAIQEMGQKRSGIESNTALVTRLFSEATERKDSVTAVVKLFNDNCYPLLHNQITPVDGAREFVLQLREMGYMVVIATNPIYNTDAIHQRMVWGGLPIEDGIYSLVTSADNMHFSKPDPAYYAEILARIGVEPDEAIMVGDSLKSDITPARIVGLHTYHMDNRTLEDFLDDLQHHLKFALRHDLDSSMIEPQLRGNIGALYGLLDMANPEFWHQRPDPNEWSIIQILCHLVAAESQTERKRLERILAEDNPFITAPKPPGPNLEPCGDDAFSIAHTFYASRQTTINMLHSVSTDGWKRPARHSIFGLTTFLEMAYFTAQHDRLHLNQLCQTIGRCRMS